jgi:hypothetical protein
MTPVIVEIVAPTITSLDFSCSRCGIIMDQFELTKNSRGEMCSEYPQEWMEEARRIGDFVTRLRNLYKHRISVYIIDAQSISGLWKQIRHGRSSLPLFIVNGNKVCRGWDCGRVEALIDETIKDCNKRDSSADKKHNDSLSGSSGNQGPSTSEVTRW